MSASTPLVLDSDSIIALISDKLPLITLIFLLLIKSLAVLVLSLEAPAPTGSKSTGLSNSLAFLAAKNIDSIVFLFNVPILIFRALAMEVISQTSSFSSAITGDAPIASIMLAQSLTVT